MQLLNVINLRTNKRILLIQRQLNCPIVLGPFRHQKYAPEPSYLAIGIPEFDDPGRKWDAGTGTQVGRGNRDAGGTREPGRRWEPGTGTHVGPGNRDAGGNREPGRRWDPKFFPI